MTMCFPDQSEILIVCVNSREQVSVILSFILQIQKGYFRNVVSGNAILIRSENKISMDSVATDQWMRGLEAITRRQKIFPM